MSMTFIAYYGIKQLMMLNICEWILKNGSKSHM